MQAGLELMEAGAKIRYSWALPGIQEGGKAECVEYLLQEGRKCKPERHSKKRICKIWKRNETEKYVRMGSILRRIEVSI
jgi:hypothetical protein